MIKRMDRPFKLIIQGIKMDNILKGEMTPAVCFFLPFRTQTPYSVGNSSKAWSIHFFIVHVYHHIIYLGTL